MEVGWLGKNEMNGDVPVSDLRHAFCAACVKGELISEISFGILYILSDQMFYKCTSFT